MKAACPFFMAATGEELRQLIATEGRRYWWHPWVPPVAQLALRPLGVPASLAAA
jgi:hypothetical protein